MTKFWNLVREQERAELYLYGEIAGAQDWGDEVTPMALKEELDACGGKPLDIYINSGGGEVFAGQAIYTMLKRYPGEKTVHIDGIAASIASVIAMAGDRVIMPENAMMMIHNAWSICVGNAADMARMAGDLAKLDGVIAGVYAVKTGKPEEEIAAAMDEETWFTAAEALEFGLCDEIEAGKAVAASIKDGHLYINGQDIDLAKYKHRPEVQETAPEAEPEPEDNADNGGASQPVQDTRALEAQKRRFDLMRREIIALI